MSRPADRLRVDLGPRSYDIVVGEGLLADAGRQVRPLLRLPDAVMVTDANVAPLCGDAVERSLAEAGVACDTLVLPAGEQTKDLATLGDLIDRLLTRGVERGTTLIALGGGVIGDITGFAAAVTLRGLDFIQIPTTLLAQVDSSVGGKTGINAARGKNLVGAFHQPRLVMADVATLDTLPRRELLAGYAEVVKYGLIGDAEFFAWLEAEGVGVVDGDAAARRHAVLTSCAAKAAVVADDEREAGQRALLNLGHTFGHALEAQVGYGDALLHGEAVAVGMVLAFVLSARLGLCPPEDAERVRRHLVTVGLPVGLTGLAGPDWSAQALMDHMGADKKVLGGRLTLILARGIGQAFITQDVEPHQVLALLDDALTDNI